MSVRFRYFKSSSLPPRLLAARFLKSNVFPETEFACVRFDIYCSETTFRTKLQHQTDILTERRWMNSSKVESKDWQLRWQTRWWFWWCWPERFGMGIYIPVIFRLHETVIDLKRAIHSPKSSDKSIDFDVERHYYFCDVHRSCVSSKQWVQLIILL